MKKTLEIEVEEAIRDKVQEKMYQIIAEYHYKAEEELRKSMDEVVRDMSIIATRAIMKNLEVPIKKAKKVAKR